MAPADPPHLSCQERFDLRQLDVVKLLHHRAALLAINLIGLAFQTGRQIKKRHRDRQSPLGNSSENITGEDLSTCLGFWSCQCEDSVHVFFVLGLKGFITFNDTINETV